MARPIEDVFAYVATVSDRARRLEFQTVTGPARPQGRYDHEPTA